MDFTQVVSPPGDSVSSLCFSPKANFLVATSWDNQVLCSAWRDDGTTVFSGGCDKQVKMWPLLFGGQPMTVAMHDAPVTEVAWIPEMSLLATGN
ncbi:Protein RAE1 [Bienertia sinuspersici]